MRKIYIDADACPVKDEVYSVAIRNNIQVIVVSNGGIRPHQHPLINIQVVNQGLDIADDWIEAKVESKDFVVTDDIPLAAKCIRKGANVIKSDGKKLNISNIGLTLANRNLFAEIRGGDPFFRGKKKVFSNRDRSKFLNALDSELSKKFSIKDE